MAKKKKDDNLINLEDQLKRALADYQNLERRVEEEKKLLSVLYTAIVVEKFLPVLDNLEAAQSHIKDEGLAMVITQFKDVLAKEGVEEVTAEGQNFDPKLHEAIEAVEGEDEGKVVKVLSKGYKINGKVLRPAKVVVTKASSTKSENTMEELQDIKEVGADA
ncbi:nucleotide exchange factor GrpE [Candidatus Curtissbacteria bacterium]|nr:nucleotide exchange factor GrpE [Candidatus Curtissbacteria bacterium]